MNFGVRTLLRSYQTATRCQTTNGNLTKRNSFAAASGNRALCEIPSMTEKSQQSKSGRVGWILGLALVLFLRSATSVEAKPAKQLFYNQDCTDFFWTSEILAGKAGETIDRYVDVIAGAGVTVFLCNSNARRTNYRSRVWDAFWDGYDPNGPDDQPFLTPIPKSEVAAYRKGIGNMLAVHQQGIDYPARVIERCRHHGISPWITLRMNDCHMNDVAAHPFHGSFWIKNPQWVRKNSPGYFATCLDYAHPEVRDYFMTLVVETLERYDIDGLELDFMREPYLFSAGKESEGALILTGWLREVRKRVVDAAARRRHPIRIGVRVPSRPEVAPAMGLDAIAWAKEGLVDVVVATPRWASIEFDMPISQWRQLLGETKATLAGGLEILYRPSPGGLAATVTPELAFGAAGSVLSQGADAVYLFNYFPSAFSASIYQSTLMSMSSLDSLQKLPRRIGVTYRDITAPGEKYQPPLPATGREISLTMRIRPIPDARWLGNLSIELATAPSDLMPVPSVLVNGTPCEFLNENPAKEVSRLLTFRIPTAVLIKTEIHEIKIFSKDKKSLTVQLVEVALRPPDGKKVAPVR